MRIRLLTYHFSDNFGALMQAYGLRHWLLKRGYDARFINYHPRYVEEGGDFSNLFDPRQFKRNLKVAYLRLSYLRTRIFGNREQAQAFETFRREQLGAEGPRLLTQAEMDGQADCDLLICGSDQIWNPSAQRGLDPVYFLDFDRPGRARRISYAASFGKSSLDSSYFEEAGKLIAGLDAVSVREVSGVDIVQAVAGRDAVTVPDPTILLGEFSDLLEPAGPQGHIFCYALRTGENISQVAELVGSHFGEKVLSSYNAHRRWREIGETVYPAPDEWLRLLNGARTVISNSFHGVTLSILLERPFIAVALPGRKRELNERVRNLLTQLDLMHRFVEDPDPQTIKQLCDTPIDWVDVRARLARMRADGEHYLEQQLALVVA